METASTAAATLRVLIVDDEAPARQRLGNLLEDIGNDCPNRIVGMVANGVEAMRLLESAEADVVLADIRMPAMDGVELARHLQRRESALPVIFVTAYEQYAVEAFELAAVDYLLKPVRAERLAAALQRLHQRSAPSDETLAALAPGARRHFSVSERGRIVLLPVAEVIYFKAELKYVTARTAQREYLLDESLVQLEQEFSQRLLRVHRNCLVARAAVLGAERAGAEEGDGHWMILLRGLEGEHARQAVSRRQWPQVRQELGL